MLLSEDADKTFHHCTACSFAIFHQRGREWPFLAASQADKPAAVLFEVGQLRRTFLLCRLAQLEARYQLAKVLIPLTGFAKQRQTCWFREMLMRQPHGRRESIAQARDGNLRPDVRLDAVLTRCLVKPCRAIKSVAIHHRESGHPKLEGALRKFLRLRAALQKRESAVGVEFDVAVSHRAPPHASLSR